MKRKLFTKTLLVASTLLGSASYLMADEVVVTDTTHTANPLGVIGHAVSKVVETGGNVVKSGARALAKGTNVVTDSVGLTDNATANNRTMDKTGDIIVGEDGSHLVHHHGYLNGYKGYRYARPGYKRYVDGWYYPEAAYNYHRAGDVVRYNGNLPIEHINYCKARYRTYRVSDNTFQPYHGPRRECVSSYYGR